MAYPASSSSPSRTIASEPGRQVRSGTNLFQVASGPSEAELHAALAAVREVLGQPSEGGEAEVVAESPSAVSAGGESPAGGEDPTPLGAGVIKAQFPVVALNVYNAPPVPPQLQGKRVLDPYTIIERDGVKIAVIGRRSAEELRHYGLAADLCPERGFNSEALLALTRDMNRHRYASVSSRRSPRESRRR